VVLASDPDADRIGCAAPLARGAAWQTLSGNQIAVLLADFILRHKQAAGTLTKDHYLVKTLVTTDMLRRLADYYGIRTIGNLLTGFRWISAAVDEFGPEKCVLACEEAHGYMIGHYARDKDAASAAMLLAEAAAEAKAHGRTLHEELARLYGLVGYHEERTHSIALPGADGLAAMRSMMQRLRSHPPRSLAGWHVVQLRDYLQGVRQRGGAPSATLEGPRGDLVLLDLEAHGNYAAVRPSGTEPKLKIYLFAHRGPVEADSLERVKSDVCRQMAAMESDLLASMAV
ncbi:MAG TPA: phospho-sugar mutase, partial [Pirellulales bacterium]|nr:phospho-sugar mutase [Pirellulales bacterium]